MKTSNKGFLKDVEGHNSWKRIAGSVLLLDVQILILSSFININIPEHIVEAVIWCFGTVVLGVSAEKYTKRKLPNEEANSDQNR